ncbi:hypothetical protein FRB95_002835 [Tulasnella sp. JGI-2019a]|nr:hypothetical protein FRB93_010941 [Tulasnella sp. JGI-2019a]KAG9031337.1 hypothetical protein FRB95_002835 [Tulasnella sp. JGI-2019a]
MLIWLLASPLFLSLVRGQPEPLQPTNGRVGSQCEISWLPDTTGKWMQTNIELMTGSNTAMAHITTVATLDTIVTAASKFIYPCPNITPTAAIYWYQFSHAAEPANLVWTTRFAIEGPNGQITAEEHSRQPGGDAIPWGTGRLVNPSLAKPAPSYIQGEASETGSNNTSMPTSTVSGPIVSPAPAGGVGAALDIRVSGAISLAIAIAHLLGLSLASMDKVV